MTESADHNNGISQHRMLFGVEQFELSSQNAPETRKTKLYAIFEEKIYPCKSETLWTSDWNWWTVWTNIRPDCVWKLVFASVILMSVKTGRSLRNYTVLFRIDVLSCVCVCVCVCVEFYLMNSVHVFYFYSKMFKKSDFFWTQHAAKSVNRFKQ